MWGRTGVETLRAWDAELTGSALAMYEGEVRRQVEQLGGYMVELANGLCLAAFPHPALAVMWALKTQQVGRRSGRGAAVVGRRGQGRRFWLQGDRDEGLGCRAHGRQGLGAVGTGIRVWGAGDRDQGLGAEGSWLKASNRVLPCYA